MEPLKFKVTDRVKFIPHFYNLTTEQIGTIKEIYPTDNCALVKFMKESCTNAVGLVFFRAYHYLVPISDLKLFPNEQL